MACKKRAIDYVGIGAVLLFILILWVVAPLAYYFGGVQ